MHRGRILFSSFFIFSKDRKNPQIEPNKNEFLND
jgi:hypothetical protein